MTFIKRFAALLGLAVFSAQAQAVEFSFVSGTVAPDAWGNAVSATVDGLTLTASAWAGTGRRGAFETAALSMQTGGGLGVCNRDEGLHCDTYSRALDNRGAADLILFRFSRAVGLGTLTLRQAGSDSDLSLWAGSGAIDPDGMARGALGTAIAISSSGDAIRSATLGGAFAGTYDWLAVSARFNQKNDFANLLALSAVPVSQPVPEAGTWAMLLAGLGLIGFVVRRRV